MNGEQAVLVVVPDGIEDPARPSGGNVYDRRLCEALERSGWSVDTRAVSGAWPQGDQSAHRALADALAVSPDGGVVLVDGLVGSLASDVLVPAAQRLRLVVLAHMAFGRDGDGSFERERAVLTSAAAVVTTSSWCRSSMIDAYALDPARVHTAPPGVDAAEPTTGSEAGSNLLCVASVTPGKGHDLLLAALLQVRDLDWRCVCVGALTVAPEFAADLSSTVQAAGLGEHLVLAGPRAGDALEESYARADALVLASRAESYGMVVTEALARGVPVIATDVGGVREALGAARDGRPPGLLVPPDDASALADALRRWLCDEDLRQGLRNAARQRRTQLTGWSETADRVARVLRGVAA